MRYHIYRKNKNHANLRLGQFFSVLALVLLLCVAGGYGLEVPAFAGDADVPVSVYFTDPDGTDLLMPQGEVVAGLLGDTALLYPGEADYLNEGSRYKFYVSEIPADSIYAHVYSDGVIVRADEYTYTTNDITVTWVPLFARNKNDLSETLAYMDYDMDLNLYSCALPGARSDTIEVYYAASFTLPSDMALSMVNEAYEIGMELKAVMDAWTEKHHAYEVYLSAHEAWKADVKAYETYLLEQEAYDTWWDGYYEERLAQYQRDMEAYEAYMALVNATPELKAEYEAKMTVALYHLSLMDRMYLKTFKSGTSEYSLWDVIDSGPAEYVIQNKDLILNVSGVDPDDVNTAVAATRALQRLIGEYEALTTGEAQYDYYVTYGAEITEHINKLYDSMTSLGEVEYVYHQIKDRNGEDVYLKFLGQLYVQGRIMDDEATLDPEQTVFGLSLPDLMMPEMIYEDTDQTVPLEAYPQPPKTSDDVPAVPYPGDPPNPDGPHPEVEGAPKKPEPVQPAGEEPSAVADPGAAPTESMTDAELALHETAQKGELIRRTEADMMVGGSFSLVTAGQTSVKSGKLVKVTVKDHTGMVLKTSNLPFGTSLTTALTPPMVSSPGGEILTFVGWSLYPTPLPQTKEERYPTLAVKEAIADMVLYPVYVMCHHPGDEATCTEPQICTVCGEILTKATGHTPGEKISCTQDQLCVDCGVVLDPARDHTPGDEATCTTAQTCTVCGETLTDALGHTPGDEATCTTAQTCTVCGETLTDALGHTPGDEATCTTAQTCTVCGETLTDALGHTPGDEATCTTPQTCTVCGETLTDALGHTPGDEATCTTAQTCTVCGETLTDALGHTPGDEATCTTAQTCTVCGETLTDALGHTPGDEATCTTAQTCTVCGEELKPAAGHSYTPVVTPPDCTTGGYTTYTCSVCQDSYKDDETQPNGHSWGDWETVTEATETQDGLKQRTCSVCQAVDEAVIPSVEHVHDYVPLVIPPTCTENGYTLHTCKCGESYRDTPVISEGHTPGEKATCTTAQTCTVCGETLADALGHTPGDEATCTTAQTCTVCGETLADALGHTPGEKATCTTAQTCTVCGEKLADALGHTPGEKATCTTAQTCTVCGEKLADALGHTPGDQATCTTAQTCTVCGETLADALGHTPGDEATCTTAQTCTVCGEKLADALGHTSGDEATCTTAQTCTVCGEKLADALGHTPGDPATCTTAQTCTVCGEKLADALGHTPGDEATCTTAQTCTVCGEKLADALGHTPGEKATCTTAQTCTVCGEKLADALGHTPGDQATCTTAQTCTVCGEKLADALGHTPGEKATCTTAQTCTVCGEELNPATGHTYGDWVVDQEAKPGAEGHQYAVCDLCGHRIEEIIEALPPVETDTEEESESSTEPEEGTETEPETESEETETVFEAESGSDTEAVTESDTEADREPVTEDVTEPETELDTMSSTDHQTEASTEAKENATEAPSAEEETKAEASTLPTVDLPEVKWYAKLLGAIGLPGLATIAGILLGGGAAGGAILIVRAIRKRRLKK